MLSLLLFSATMVVSNSLSVTVLGGTGFLGSRVCKLLVEGGASVRSVSKSGKVPTWCSGESWTSSVEWVANDLIQGSRESLKSALGSPEAVISCVGSVGFDTQLLLLGNGKANVDAAKEIKAIGSVSKYVYVSVASEVSDCQNGFPGLPAFFTGYFQGKKQAEEAIIDAMGDADKVTFIKPSFIYGGDSFGLFPPRVTTGYGAAIEELLSYRLVEFFADILPGLIKVALRPPVNVDSLAKACSGAVLGTVDAKVLDGTLAINAATKNPASTGLTDAIQKVKESKVVKTITAKVDSKMKELKS